MTALGGQAAGRSLFERLGLPSPDLPQWTPQRVDRHSSLTEARPRLCTLYGAAVNLLPTFEIPGYMNLISHCVREIFNRFPDQEVAIRGLQNEQAEAVKRLADCWEESTATLAPDPDEGGGATLAEDPLRVVRQSAYVAAAKVVSVYRAGRQASYRRSLYYVAGTNPSVEFSRVAGAVEVDRCAQFFVEYAHVGKELPNLAELEEQFLLFETILDLRLKDWWSATDAVENLVANANRRLEGFEEAGSRD
jgi:hypothetical protein